MAPSTNKLLTANGQLLDAATTISKGAGDLANGIVTLNDGVSKLSDGSNALKDGTNKLSTGSNELVDGIKTFNNEGIMKIYNMVNGDVKNTFKRLEKLDALSNSYNKFGSEISRDEIKFINIIDSVKINAKEETHEEIVISSEKED